MPRNKPHNVFQLINMHGGNDDVCWEWIGYHTGKGRPSFDLGGRKVTPYRIVYELIHGVTIPRDVMVRHKCDNGELRVVDGVELGACCNPRHLELGSHKENMNDMKTRERHGLPHHTVRAIKRLLEEGEQTHEQIATLYGVDRSTIGRIATGRAYGHVDKVSDSEEQPGSQAGVDSVKALQ